MALLDFGGKAIWVTGTGAAPFEQVLDVGLYFANMTLLLELIGLQSSGGSPSFVLTLETAMDPNAKTWTTLAAFSAMSAANSREKTTVTDLLRYVRWNVTTFTNITTASFTLSGVARNA